MQKLAIVTGGSSGIGLALVKKLVEHGVQVLSISRRPMAPLGYEHIQADIGDVECILRALNKRTVTYIVNNAGLTRDGLFARMQPEQIDEVLDTNLAKPMKLTQALFRYLDTSGQGRIVNIGSVVGFIGNIGQSNYAASKAGLSGFTRSLVHEVARKNATINTIAPGYIETEMTAGLSPETKTKILQNIPLNRLGTVDDVVNAVMFLLSEAGSYITGSTIHVNGGLYVN